MLFSVLALDDIFRPYPGHATNLHNVKLMPGVEGVAQNGKTSTNPYS